MPISLATNMTVKVLTNSRKGILSNAFGELVRREQSMRGAKQGFVYPHGPAFEWHDDSRPPFRCWSGIDWV